MIAPTLTASEIAAVRAARSMTRQAYPGGSCIAKDGNTVLFRSGAAGSFDELWAQAEKVRAEVKA